MKVDINVGGTGLPKDVLEDLKVLFEKLEQEYNFKHGSTAAFWNVSLVLSQHIGEKK